ncbi:acylneuraminate cytidylyltransferase family protein [Candidatus Pseudothioglobus singularis]|jgi:CMP-N-acetylneuraminic acid synthetase|nr:acylneuraminate cytidylyltransferase family protein [Candidatus Pseudothioglobus singularis]
MKIYAFIFARGGSKGVPGKNIKLLAGKPLLAHAIELADKVPVIDSVFVSTDDESIANVANQYGAEVINRPKALAQDDTPEWLAWQHAIKWVNNNRGAFDVFVSLPTTSPLRNENDIERCVNALDDNSDIVLTASETTRSPWFNMVSIDQKGNTKLLIDSSASYSRRQDVPKAFSLTTVAYVSRPEFIINSGHIFDGRVKSVMIPEERSIDIDTELDFKIANFLKRSQ